jgi:exodeoxyribonuclease VII large subunit
LQNSRLRWPEVQFEVIHTHVQGDKAVNEIIFALGELDANPLVDVIIIARGGGSFQDLLPFSDERLVRYAATLTKPVVSAIGHENDQPLLDLVADLRASTPTDAAKRVVPDVVEERRNLGIALQRIRLRVASYLDSQQQLIAQLVSRPVIASPYGFVDAQFEVVTSAKRRIREIFDFRIQRSTAEIQALHAQARSLSPQLTLERGYSVVTDKSGRPAKSVKPSDILTIRTSNQEISASVTSVKETK